MADHLEVNRANWDARADVHGAPDGYDRLAEPGRLSDVVRFDRPLLGDIAGLSGVHLQCHLGTDTLSLSRLGAQMVGVDLSPNSLRHARAIAADAGERIEFVEADVYSAPAALGGRRFDLVYTGIGALCWLPDIRRWAAVAAALLQPGGRLFVRDGHPVLNALLPATVGATLADADQQPWLTAAGTPTPALELPYWERPEPLVWRDEVSYAGAGAVASPEAHEWNHALSQIVMAVLEAGLVLESLTEHDSVPWDALPGLMSRDAATGEYRLTDRPERLPASFTLTARRPG